MGGKVGIAILRRNKSQNSERKVANLRKSWNSKKEVAILRKNFGNTRVNRNIERKVGILRRKKWNSEK